MSVDSKRIVPTNRNTNIEQGILIAILALFATNELDYVKTMQTLHNARSIYTPYLHRYYLLASFLS